MEKDVAISVKNVSKTFKIPHEKISSLRGAFVNALKSNSFEEFKALDNISFEVKKGEFFGIIGRNGSGKSTLLKILAGIYQPNEGKIKIDGRISPFLELGIGFNPELSGRDNVYLNATVLGLSKKQIDKKFDSIVAFSELERFIDQKLKNYSSGMQVRLAFSVSIHANREILLMDEVLAVGDTNFQSKCLTEFNRYKEMGKTVVLVTHDIGTIQKYCDRAILMRNGKIVINGRPMDVIDTYTQDNIVDEESRIQDEERKKTDKSKKDDGVSTTRRIAKITNVVFHNGDGNEKYVFQSGEDIFVRVYFKKNKEVPELNFGIALFNQQENYMFGINTFLDKKDTSKYYQQEYFEVLYEKNRLAKNVYYVKAGIWGSKIENTIDFLSKSSTFRIHSKSLNDGIFEMDYKWI